MDPDRTSTAERLRRIMQERGLKQVDILRLVNPVAKRYDDHISANTLSQYVNGKVEPRQDRLHILSIGLNVSEAWLMGFDVDPDRSKAHPEETIPPLSLTLSSHEIDLILAYRANLPMQPAVNRLLNIPDEKP